jgi:hypothetical protein
MTPRLILAMIAALVLGAACAQERYGEVYDETANAAADIDAVLAEAETRGVPALLVFGANWCHDSRGLAHALETHEALNAFIAEHYALAFIDVGTRSRNLDQLARFGVDHIFGTPTLVVANGAGETLNADSVHHWRTVDDADPADVGAYLAGFAGADLPIEPDATADLEAVIAAWPPYQTALAALEDAQAAEAVDAEAAAVRAAYYGGLARSMARRAMGLEAEEQGLSVARVTHVAPDAARVDLTAAVVARLAESELDMIERGDRELDRYEE